MENQAFIFFIFILNGFIIGLLFDIFRVIRKTFKTSDLITYIQDILFWIISAIIILYSLFKFNNGQLRAYILLGLIIGASLYLLIFSKLFIKTSIFIIETIKKIIQFIFIKPVKSIYSFIKRIMRKPIRFIFINFKKILSKFRLKFKKIGNKRRI